MAAVEAIKIVLPSSVQFGNAVQGGTPSITSSDIAAAMSHLSRPASAYARMKYCMDDSYRPYLEDHTRSQVYKQAERNRWSVYDVSVLSRIARTALSEALHDGVCKGTAGCGGVGTVIDLESAKLVPCPKCQGSGRSRYTISRRARALGMHRNTYQATWARRYEWIFNKFQEYEYDLSSTLRRNL